MNNWLEFGDTAPLPTDISTLLLGLLLAFLCGQLLAWIYMFTHSGLSYSRNFVSSLIILPITVSLVMMILDNNIVTAFSLLAVFAIVRFRNILRDTLDSMYILSLIVIGMACGTQKFTTALIGAGIICLILLFAWFTNFGSRQRHDLILNVNWNRPLSSLEELQNFLRRHALRFSLATQRSDQSSDSVFLSYRLLMRDPDRVDLLIDEISELEGVASVSSLKTEDESEV